MDKKLLLFVTLISLNSCAQLRGRDVSSFSGKGPFFGNILVYREGKVIEEQTLGMANLEFEVKNTTQSKFLLASVSKQFTAAAIYQLKERGRVDLNDPITKYIPLKKVHESNRGIWKKITIKDLLEHRAGLMKDIQDDFINLAKKRRLSTLIDKVIKDPRLTTKNYGKYYYSNIGYNILARVVEKASGFDFDMYVSFKLFRALEMKDSGVYHRSKVIPLMSEGYYVDEDSKFKKFCCQDYSNHTGSHNLYSTTHDLLKWVKEVSHKHNVIPMEFTKFSKNYANGLFRAIDPKLGEYFWHDGFSAGYASRIAFYPEKDIAIIILLNRVNVFTAQDKIESIHRKYRKEF